MPYDDSWRDSYDAWKLRSPDDEYGYYDDDPEEDCEHEDYDIDVCTGRASCNCCDYRWYLSAEQIDAELDRQANYQQDCERFERQEGRREFWRKLTYPIRLRLWRLLRRWWPRKAIHLLNNDDLPF